MVASCLKKPNSTYKKKIRKKTPPLPKHPLQKLPNFRIPIPP